MARAAGSKGHYTIAMLDSKGKPVPGMEWPFDSVTTVLDTIAKPALMHWYYREGIKGIAELMERYGDKLPADFESLLSLLKTEKLSPYSRRDSAAKTGTDIHAEFEKLCLGETIERTPETEGLLNWWEVRGLTPSDIIATERPLVSFKHRIAGTFDVMYRDPETDKIVLSDLKTGKHISWTHFVQGEAYRLMVDESGLPSPSMVTVIHCRPPGELAGPSGFTELQSPEITIDTFLAALSLYRGLPVKWKAEDLDAERIV